MALVVASDAISGACNSKQQLKQKFSVSFVTSSTQQQAKSGNPGYINGLPLLVGQSDATTGGVLAYFQGFSLVGADTKGKCLTSASSSLSDYADPIITFGEDLVYTCSISLTQAQLQSYCGNQPQIQSLPLFSNLAFWQLFGRFGNANIYSPKDWTAVTIDESFSSLGAGTLNGPACTSFYSSVNYKLYWSTVGYQENPQSYIVKVVKEALPETWTFNQQLNGNSQQTFQH